MHRFYTENEMIPFSYLNDFMFCPVSIYVHSMYEDLKKLIYQTKFQLNGSNAHKRIDEGKGSFKEEVCSLFVVSNKYGLYGKIDKYNTRTKCLIECKKHIGKIYDGYIFQLYAQYFGMKESGYSVHKLSLYSMDDNKKYEVKTPEKEKSIFSSFEQLIEEIHAFKPTSFFQENETKCAMCIYAPACPWEIAK